MSDDPNIPPEPDEALPSRLRDAFSRMSDNEVRVPPEVDARILSRAKAEYARRTRFRPAVRWISGIGAVAAAVTVAFVVHGTFVRPVHHFAKGDINGDGKVDMLDAFILARHVSAGNKTDSAWDVNGDGKVDQSDIDWIANSAVSIQPATATQGGTQ